MYLIICLIIQIDIARRSTCTNKEETCCRNSTYFGLRLDADLETIIRCVDGDCRPKCGFRNQDDAVVRIGGGQETVEAEFGEWPHMCIVLKWVTSPNTAEEEEEYVGGASLIAPNIVLTSAHNVA